MLVSESLVKFLTAQSLKQPSTLLDRVLARPHTLELQVNVARGDGEPVAGRPNTFSNGVYEYSGFRIPHHADSVPDWKDWDIKWPLDLHADSIGATGWDWVEGRSWWVGYDVDSKHGHAAGLDEAQLQAVIEAGLRLPYLEVRKSSSGRGLHLYVLFDGIPTANHTEHSVLARAVLAKMCDDSGFDFRPYIDVFGGNMWVWRRNQTPESFQLIQAHRSLLTAWTDKECEPDAVVDISEKIPRNWRDTIPPTDRIPSKHLSIHPFLLSDAQKQFIDTLAATNYSVIWQPDKSCLHTHTCAIKEVHAELKMRGVFETISAGEHPSECNCYCYPLDNDAWRVVRFSQGTQEASTWSQDGTGWTSCEINKSVSLTDAAAAFNGVELPKSKGFIFEDAAEAIQALAAMGHTIEIPAGFEDRRIKMEPQKDGRPILSLERHQEDVTPANWCAEKRAWFERVVGPKPEQQQNDFANHYRLVYPDDSNDHKPDWWYKPSGGWKPIDRATAELHLKSRLHDTAAVTDILGQAADTTWHFVDEPFGPEELGNRQWNLKAAQLRIQPTTRPPVHPTWDKVFGHTFSGLDSAVQAHPWCREHGINTGMDYARLWVASMIRRPFDRTPYLFLTGSEDCGKSTFHESLAHLITHNGIMDASTLLGGKDMFTGALRHAVLVYIEEKSFDRHPTAASLMKKWTGCEYLDIRAMRRETIRIRNKLHFVQVANENTAAPFSGSDDTRITMVWVGRIKDYIAPGTLHSLLQAEAPHMLRTLLELPLPPTDRSRFCLPMIETDHKLGVQLARKTMLKRFIDAHCTEGRGILLGEFCDRYTQWANEQNEFDGNSSVNSVITGLPSDYPLVVTKGIAIVSNLTWKKPCTDH